MKPFFLFLCGSIIIISCHKNDQRKSCVNANPFEAIASVGELVGDSAIETDTAFIGTIIFKGKNEYITQEWKIGDDPRIFSQEEVILRFPDPVPRFNVVFSASGIPNKECFPNDSGYDSTTKALAILPRDENARTELIGNYLGYIEGKQTDTFTVSIKFYSDKKYSQYFGSQPFYYINNFPKGFRDTTSSIGTSYPELSRGFACEWGYRAIYIDADNTSAQMVRGYASLKSHDSLVIDYTRADLTVPFNDQTGYPRLREKFIGIRVN